MYVSLPIPTHRSSSGCRLRMRTFTLTGKPILLKFTATGRRINKSVGTGWKKDNFTPLFRSIGTEKNNFTLSVHSFHTYTFTPDRAQKRIISHQFFSLLSIQFFHSWQDTKKDNFTAILFSPKRIISRYLYTPFPPEMTQKKDNFTRLSVLMLSRGGA